MAPLSASCRLKSGRCLVDDCIAVTAYEANALSIPEKLFGISKRATHYCYLFLPGGRKYASIPGACLI